MLHVQNSLNDVLTPLELCVQIPTEVPKPEVNTSGNRTATDLLPYPRLRQAGDDCLSVGLCGSDGVCQSDLELNVSSVKYM